MPIFHAFSICVWNSSISSVSYHVIVVLRDHVFCLDHVACVFCPPRCRGRSFRCVTSFSSQLRLPFLSSSSVLLSCSVLLFSLLFLFSFSHFLFCLKTALFCTFLSLSFVLYFSRFEILGKSPH